MAKLIGDLKKYYKYAVYSAKAELKSEIANSHLSWLWWILDPLLFMLVYAFISSVVFNSSEKYFLAFVFIGLSCWDFFNRSVKQSVTLVSRNSQVVSKVYLPKYILILIKMGTNGFKMMISFILVIGMMIIYKVPISATMLWFFPILVLLVVFTFACSVILLHFGVFVEDLANIVNVLLRLVFYLSGIFYSISSKVPEPYRSVLLRLNPMALIMEDMRKGLLYGQNPHVSLLVIWFVISIIVSAIGIQIIYKYENSYVKVM